MAMGVCQQCVKLVTVCRLNMRFNRCPRYVVLTLCIEVNLILGNREEEGEKENLPAKKMLLHSPKIIRLTDAGQLSVLFTGSPAP